MKRLLVVSVGLAALMVGVVLAWSAVRQEREFQRLIAAGDAAFAQDQTYGAIEAFSGALVLKRDSMLAHLRRGDTYRRRGELTAALRDLREAVALDPSAPRPIELLGDVNAAMGRYERASEHYQAFIVLDDRSPRVLYKLALAYYRNRQVEEAIEPLGDAVALDGRFSRREKGRLLTEAVAVTGYHRKAIHSCLAAAGRERSTFGNAIYGATMRPPPR